MGCKETLINKKEVPSLSVGTEFTINCPLPCTTEDKSLLYGDRVYPVTSGVCISAFHAGIIGERGG